MNYIQHILTESQWISCTFPILKTTVKVVYLHISTNTFIYINILKNIFGNGPNMFTIT